MTVVLPTPGEVAPRLRALAERWSGVDANERVEEEKRGLVRWLRPEYQIPRFAPEQAPAMLDLDEKSFPKAGRGRKTKIETVASKAQWPMTAIDKISATPAVVTQKPGTAADVARAFVNAKLDLVQRHLETLTLMGELALDTEGRYRIARRAA